MPTVLRIEGFRFFFFSNEEGEPVHVHVEKAEGYAKLWLDPLSFAGSRCLTPSQMRRVRQLVEEHRDELIEAWRQRFGE